MAKTLNVPYQSQNSNPFNDKYAGSDSDSSDPTPDGCWMNPKDGSDTVGYGPGSKGCKANYDCPGRGSGNGFCVRPGSCNTTSLFMALKFLGLDKPAAGPKGEALNSWLSGNDFSATWIYHWILDYFNNGQNIGSKPNYSNSGKTALADNWIAFVKAAAKKTPGKVKQASYVSKQDFATYKKLIDANSPVVMSIGGHIVLGVGYEDSGSMIVHDPYGRRKGKGRKSDGWDKYNACGAGDATGQYGKQVTYSFEACQNMLLSFDLEAGYAPGGGSAAQTSAPPPTTTSSGGSGSTYTPGGGEVYIPADKLPRKKQGGEGGMGDTNWNRCGYCCQILTAVYLQKLKGKTIEARWPGDSHKGEVAEMFKGSGYLLSDNIVAASVDDAGKIKRTSDKYDKLLATVDQYLSMSPPLPVICGVDHDKGSANGDVDIDHFVLIVGRAQKDGKTVYKIHDVGGGDEKFFYVKDGVLFKDGIDYRATGKKSYISQRRYVVTAIRTLKKEDGSAMPAPTTTQTQTGGTGTTGAGTQPQGEPKPPFAGFQVAWPLDFEDFYGEIDDPDKWAKKWGIKAGQTPYELAQRAVCGPGTGWFPRYENGDWHPGVDIGMHVDEGDITGYEAFGYVVDGVNVKSVGPGRVVAKSTQGTDDYSHRYYVIEHKAGPVTFYASYAHLHEDMGPSVGDEVAGAETLATVGPHGKYPHLYLSIIAQKQYGADVLTPVAQSKDEAMNMDGKQASMLMAVKVDKVGPEWGNLSARQGWWAYHPLHFLRWLEGKALDTRPQQAFLSECTVKAKPNSTSGGGTSSIKAALASEAMSGNADLQVLAANKNFTPKEKGWDKKEAVKALQKALVLQGYNLGTSGPNKDGVDGDWGKKTTTAIQDFQTNKLGGVLAQIPGGKASSDGRLDWTTLIGLDILAKAAESGSQKGDTAPSTQVQTLPQQTEGTLTMKQLRVIMRVTMKHETGYTDMTDERMYTRCNKNSDGCGLSYGCIQFAQKVKSLGGYLKKCKEKDEGKLQEIFGSDLTEILDKLTSNDEDERMSVRAWEEPLLGKFQKIGKHAPFQEVQIALAVKNYLNPWIMQAMARGVKSPRGLALMFDTAVQNGPGRVWNKAKPDKCLLGIIGEKGEKTVRGHLKDVPELCAGWSGKWADNVRTRRQKILDSADYDDTMEWTVDAPLGDNIPEGDEEQTQNQQQQQTQQSPGGGPSQQSEEETSTTTTGGGGANEEEQEETQEEEEQLFAEWTVEGPDGKPLANATVEMQFEGEAAKTYKTDGQGHFRVDLPASKKGKTYTLTVKQPSASSGDAPVVTPTNQSTNENPPPVQEEEHEEEQEKPPSKKVKSSKITVGGKDFADWFNTVFYKIPLGGLFGNKINAEGFKTVWDHLKELTGRDEISLNEFIAHFSIMYNELGGTFQPRTENGDDKYFFEAISGKKSSYNGLYQRLAGDQLSNKPGGNDHPALGYKAAGWGKISKQVDIDAWNSKTKYPVSPPSGSAFTQSQWDQLKTFARNCDFYKYRGRGLNQLTLRGNYLSYADPPLKKHYSKGAEQMTNEELDAAMKDPKVYCAAFCEFNKPKMDVIAKVDQNPPVWREYGYKVGGSWDYADNKMAKRCAKLLEHITSAGYECK